MEHCFDKWQRLDPLPSNDLKNCVLPKHRIRVIASVELQLFVRSRFKTDGSTSDTVTESNRRISPSNLLKGIDVSVFRKKSQSFIQHFELLLCSLSFQVLVTSSRGQIQELRTAHPRLNENDLFITIRNYGS